MTYESITHHLLPITSMSDPYFQTLFAERIGGNQYGKGTEIYKFEKIKRAKPRRWPSIPSGN